MLFSQSPLLTNHSNVFLQSQPLTNRDFEAIAFEVTGLSCATKTGIRQYEAFFGTAPIHCAIIWYELEKSGCFNHAPAAVKPVHLLMGLHFLKAYNREERNAVLFLCTEKTFRQWAWYIVKCIANLDKVMVRKACYCVLYHIVLRWWCYCSALLLTTCS